MERTIAISTDVFARIQNMVAAGGRGGHRGCHTSSCPCFGAPAKADQCADHHRPQRTSRR